MGQSSYISRSEINEKLAADREYLYDLLSERKELEPQAAAINERVEDLDRKIAKLGHGQ